MILLLLCMNPATLRADEFTNFRIPANRYLQWTGSAFGSSGWGHSADGPEHGEGGSLQGALQSSLNFWRESDSRSMSISASASNSGFRSHIEQQTYYIDSGSLLESYSDERSQRELREFLGLTTTQRWYPGGGPWNLATDLRGSFNDSQSWSNSQSSLQIPPSGLDVNEVRSNGLRTYRADFSWGVGLGFGRVRNGTGVYEARVLEDRLRASGALSRSLGPEARQRLAALMYARGDFDASMDYPASTAWDAVERILKDDGSLSTPTLSARDLFRLTEPYIGNFQFNATGRNGFPSSPIFRAIGWNIGATLSGRNARDSRWYETASTIFLSDSGGPQPPVEYRAADHFHSSSDALWGLLSAEYHRPVSMRLQWDASAGAAFPLRHERHGFQFGAQTGLGCIVADRWMTSLAIRQSRTIDKDANSVTLNDSWSTQISAVAYYFVADHVTLRVSAAQSWSKARSDFYYFFPGTSSDNNGRVEFGLTYRFAGFTRIEGLFPAGTTLN